MEIILGIALLLSIAGNVIAPILLFKHHAKETRELHIRLATKSQQEAEFWLNRPKEKKKEEKEAEKKEREYENLSDLEKERIEKAKGF